ncbi:MAG: bifunctional phosphoglucose/phosphomannose isomerase [Patescibacteria group bacterium]
MYEAIKNFNMQFEYKPKIENDGKLKKFKRIVAVGMGGSNLASGLLKIWKPELDLIIHRDYGLPPMAAEDLKTSLIICNSYSGNTEEVLEAFDAALSDKLNVIAISTGGKLLELAKENSRPYIKMPGGLQPRSAIGFNFLALLKAIGEEDAIKEAAELAASLNPSDYEHQGHTLAKKIKDLIPVVYSSSKNQAIAYNWKVRLNETAKVPAFFNSLPEANHNEILGASENFYFILIKDNSDHQRILKRMEVLKKIYSDRQLKVETVALEGDSAFSRIFSSIVLADWTAFHLAKERKVDPEQVPLIEEFKKLI